MMERLPQNDDSTRSLDSASALAIFDELKERNERSAGLVLRAAKSLLKTGNREDAQQILVEAASHFPEVAGFILLQARTAREAGHLDQATDLLEKARRRFPGDDEPIIESGWLAHITRDWQAAANWWAEVRRRAPQHLVGFLNGAIALRELGRCEEADALLRRAMELFPRQSSPAIEYAACAQHRKDWTETVARWRIVRERFPDIPESFTGAARALREQGLFDEARGFLQEASRQFPNNAKIEIDRCWLEHVAHDWAEAARRWGDLRTRHPELPVGWTSGAIALRELRQFDDAETLLREAQDRFPNERAPWVEYAWLATARRDWPEAAGRWEKVRERYPELPVGYLRGSVALTETWQHEAAERLLVDAITRFPSDAAPSIEYAAIALHLNRIEEAAVRYRNACDRFPDSAEAQLGVAVVLRNQFRIQEAEAALEQACRRLPHDPRLWLEHAKLPIFAPMRRDRRPDEALRRLENLRLRFPERPEGYISAIRLLRDEGRLVEAAALADQSIEKLPLNNAIAVEHASVGVAQGNWSQAAQRFTLVRERFPKEPSGSIGLAQAFAACGRVSEAEVLLREVMTAYPNLPAGYTAYAEIAMRHHDWPEALARWQAASSRFPEDKSFIQRIYDVRLHLTEDATDSKSLEPTAVEVRSTNPRDQLRDLVTNFESLGGRGIGCEFGMFQREFGAEPLGLLRWADMPYDGLMFVLENRFARVGDPENTEVFVNLENGRPEYCTRDLRGFMFMRAFVYEDEMPMARMRKQALKRLVFLKDKLIADLSAGRKVFVWRCTQRNLDETEIDRLHAALRSYGDNTLLYVRYKDVDHPNGTIEQRAPGLMIGYIDRFKMSVEGKLFSAPASASWMTLCQRAYSICANGRDSDGSDRISNVPKESLV